MKANHKKYFDSHPKEKEFHFTKDGLAFRNKGTAEQHQKTLTGKITGVESVKRNEKVEKPEEVENKLSEMKSEELEALLVETQQLLTDADEADKDALELKLVEIEVAIENLD
jgi:ribosomal protein S8